MITTAHHESVTIPDQGSQTPARRMYREEETPAMSHSATTQPLIPNDSTAANHDERTRPWTTRPPAHHHRSRRPPPQPVATLRWWRHVGTGPHSFKIGRGVRYRLSDVHAWIDQQHGQQSA